MPESSQEFKALIEERINDESEVKKSLYNSIEKTSNSIVRLMLYQMALDSAKHENMLNLVLRLLESDGESETGAETKEFLKTVVKHVESENNMIKSFEGIIEKTADRRIKFILQEIVSDERRHHAIVKRIGELISNAAQVRDEKWWDFLYRYSHLSE